MNIIPAYLAAGILFIFSIRGLASPQTARRGNLLGILGMLIAVMATMFFYPMQNLLPIILTILAGAIVGVFFSQKVKMTALPQMIAAFNGLGGLSSALIAAADAYNGSTAYLENALGMLIGAIAFSGSVIAFAKLHGLMSSQSITFPGQQFFNLIFVLGIIFATISYATSGNIQLFEITLCLSLIFGLLLVLPVGGADMPVVISVLNAYSGWAAVGIGFSLDNILLIIVGSLVGASGTILSYIMTKAMNRSLSNVMFGGIGSDAEHNTQTGENAQNKQARSGSPEDAAFIMENANKVIIVPGYGMAVAQAQHILKEMADDLQKKGIEVKYAIHPVAGRMPGHMNVLLAEANVPYEDVFELEDINREFATADVAYVIGANDVTNPLAKNDPNSPIYGMPVLDVEKAKTVFFVKRSLGSGYSGVQNPLFFAENTIMLYGDAKKVTEEIVSSLE